MMATANFSAAIEDLKRRIHGIATALVGRDGQVRFASVPDGTYAETFAIMCATMFGAAATANTELARGRAIRVVVEGDDSTTVIVGAGRWALLAVVVPNDGDLARVFAEVERFADLLRVD